MRRLWFIFLLILVNFCGLSVARAEAPDSAEKNSPSVNLLAMGDWGNNQDSQRKVAGSIANYVKSSGAKFDGMLLAGDNFYVKLTGTKDPLWRTMFEEMYDPAICDFPFYVSFGNHDYQDGKNIIERDYARENPQSRWKLPARYYRVEIPKDNPLVTVLMLDSNRQIMSEADWNAETYWLRNELSKTRKSKWLIACAHHPLFSNGDHGDNGVMQKSWGPLFNKAHLDMFVAGHDHDIQHLQVEGFYPSFILVGGGGQHLRPMRVDKRGPFSKSSFGFASMRFTPDEMIVKLISGDGEMLHEFHRTPAGNVKTIETEPSDIATPRTVKSIVRGGDDTSTTKPTTRSTTQAFEAKD
jgi:hypothetical protein